MSSEFFIRIKNGSFYLDAALYARFFAGVQAVAILLREGRILLMPLRQLGSGGTLVKVRNARGDRVIHAPDVLRGLDLDESDEYDLAVRWDAELAALSMPHPNPASGVTRAAGVNRVDDHGY